MREQFSAAAPSAVILWALSFAVAEYALWRSRRVLALASAVTPMFAWVALDGLRQAGVLPPIPDVLAFCALPACWMALLPAERGSLIVERVEHAANDSAVGDASHQRFGHEPQEERGHHHPPILPRLAPLAACLAYAAALLALRHQPAVRAHWTGALQLPRLVAFGWALAVGLQWRLKDEGPGVATPEPSSTFAPLRPVATILRSGEAPESGGARLTYRPALPPSTAIGIVMALGGGICAAGGLWADWHDVRAVAAVAWGLSAAIVWRAWRAR